MLSSVHDDEKDYKCCVNAKLVGWLWTSEYKSFVTKWGCPSKVSTRLLFLSGKFTLGVYSSTPPWYMGKILAD